MKMNYVVLVRYFNGATIGYTVKADTPADAWNKLYNSLTLGTVQAVELAELLAPDAEIK